jgi:hypothetical protein
MVFIWDDRRSDKQRGRKKLKREKRRKPKCLMPECGRFAHYGWAFGLCQRHAIMRGCSKAANKSAAGKVEKRSAEAEVTKPWWLDEDTELEDREAYEEDYEEVLRCLGNRSDDVGAAPELRNGQLLGSAQEIRNLHCWLVGEEWSQKDHEKIPDEEGFLVHQWETKGQVPLEGWLPRDGDGCHILPIGALAHAVLWGCESDLAVSTNVLKDVSDDWLRGMELGSIKKAWWQTMHRRRLRQKTTVRKYDVWSEMCGHPVETAKKSKLTKTKEKEPKTKEATQQTRERCHGGNSQASATQQNCARARTCQSVKGCGNILCDECYGM